MALVRYARTNGLWTPSSSPASSPTLVPGPLYVANDYGGEIPAFGCVQITGTREEHGQNYLKVDQPADIAASAGMYLYNGPNAIEEGGFGWCQSGPILRVLTDGTAMAAGERWGPKADQFEIGPGGYLTCCGEDDVAEDVMRAYAVDTPHIFFGRSSSLILSGASGDVTIYSLSGTPSATSTVVSAKNIAGDQSSVNNYLGVCREAASGLWIVFFEVCA